MCLSFSDIVPFFCHWVSYVFPTFIIINITLFLFIAKAIIKFTINFKYFYYLAFSPLVSPYFLSGMAYVQEIKTLDLYTYANLFMGYLEQDFLDSEFDKPNLWTLMKTNSYFGPIGLTPVIFFLCNVVTLCFVLLCSLLTLLKHGLLAM